MHKHELEEQLEESKECIERLLDHLDILYEAGIVGRQNTIDSVVYEDAEKFLESLNG